MKVKGIRLHFRLLFCLIVCFSLGQPCFAQSNALAEDNTPLIAVKRIALVNLDGVIRNAEANNRIRELLDGHRAKFQEEFRAVEVDLQKSERDLLSRRDSMAKDEYDKLVTAFRACCRVAKRYSIQTTINGCAYQKHSVVLNLWNGRGQ